MPCLCYVNYIRHEVLPNASISMKLNGQEVSAVAALAGQPASYASTGMAVCRGH